MNIFSNLRKKAKTIGTVAASAGAITVYSSSVAHAAGMLEGITLDTVTVLAAATLVVAAYGALWAINKVIGIFKK